MKKLLLALALIAALAFTSKADNLVYPLTANVVSNLFTVGKIIDTITVTATTTNTTTLKFYDSSNTTTTYVAAAYSNYTSYATNFSQIFTNESGVLITNSFTGRWTYPATVAASTNTIPAIYTIVVPASGQRTKEVHLQTMRGLNVIPNFGAIIEVDYRNNP